MVGTTSSSSFDDELVLVVNSLVCESYNLQMIKHDLEVSNSFVFFYCTMGEQNV